MMYFTEKGKTKEKKRLQFETVFGLKMEKLLLATPFSECWRGVFDFLVFPDIWIM